MGFLDIYFKENQFLIMLVAIVLGWWVYKPHMEAIQAADTWAAEEGKRKAAKREELKKAKISDLKFWKMMGKLREGVETAAQTAARAKKELEALNKAKKVKDDFRSGIKSEAAITREKEQRENKHFGIPDADPPEPEPAVEGFLATKRFDKRFIGPVSKKLRKLKKRAKIIKEKAIRLRGGNNNKEHFLGGESTEIMVPSDEFKIVNDDDAEPGYVL